MIGELLVGVGGEERPSLGFECRGLGRGVGSTCVRLGLGGR